MANNNWSRWYREGTVNVTNGSKTVVGTDTFWASASIKAGDIFSLDGVTDYEVYAVTDNTHLTLMTAYTGTSANGQTYHVVRAFSSTTGAQTAAQTADLVSDMARYLDSDHVTLHGKSAYEIAKTNGFVGTEAQWLASLVGKNAYEVAVAGGYKGTQAQWLEDLKAANEWTVLNNRTAFINEASSLIYGKYESNESRQNLVGPGTWRNCFIRGKNLGSAPTAEQYAAIDSGKFTDMFPGDYWLNNGVRYRILHLDYFNYQHSHSWTDPATGESRAMTGANWDRNQFTIPHAVVQAEGGIVIDNYYLNPTDDKNEDGTWAGYTSCEWYRVARPKCIEIMEAVFGAEHMLEWCEAVPTGYSAEGVPTGWLQALMRCELPTHRQILGYPYQPLRSNAKRGSINWEDSLDFGAGQFALYQTCNATRSQSFSRSFWMRDIYGTISGSPAAKRFNSWYGHTYERPATDAPYPAGTTPTVNQARGVFAPIIMLGTPYKSA